MARTLRGQEGVGGDAQAAVVVEAAPAASLKVVQAQLVLQFLVVPLHPPTQLSETDEGPGLVGAGQVDSQ